MKVQLLAVCFLTLFSCNNQRDKSTTVSSAIASEEADNDPEATPETSEVETFEADFSKEPAKTVLDFLKWYRKHYSAINRIVMVDQNITNAHPYYTVNTKGTDAYLRLLGKSGFLSPVYLDGWRNYFRERDAFLYSNHQTDGPPEGFQYDFVLWTQETDEALKKIDQAKIIEVQQMSADRVKISVDIYMRLRFTLSKTGDKWLIDDIENRGQR